MAGTIRKRTWVTRKGEQKTAWLADYFDQHRKRHTKQFTTKKAADAWLLRARGEISEGIHTPDAGSITLAEAGKRWLARCEAEGLERATLQHYQIALKRHIEPFLGALRLTQVSPPVVENWRDELLRRCKRPRAQSILDCLKGILKNATRQGLLAYNPASGTRIDQKKREREPIEVGRGIPSKEEVQAILLATPERWRALLVTAAFTGMRASELRGLTWDAVDLRQGVLEVRQRADFWGTQGPPKTAAGRRKIPLAPIVVNALKEYRLAYPPGQDGLVFYTRSYGRGPRFGVLGHSALSRMFPAVQREAGVVDATGRHKYHFHALRHFFASAGIEAGFAPKRLQAILGHASITMTYDVYGHLFPNPEDDQTKLATIERAVVRSA
jgi:integrase